MPKQLNNDDVAALAAAIYGEARNQGPLGRAAVGHTALTRSQIADVPVADVVYGSVSDKYGQYSFANPNDPNARTVAGAPENDPDGWAEAVETAKGVLSGEIENPVPGATNYKTSAVSPAWADKASNLGKVGAHTFYALPSREVRGVVRQAAASPYRREDLVPPETIDGVPVETSFPDLPDVEGNPQSISLGEFDFAGPRVERGFGRMLPETQHVASEMARTLPAGEDMTITATHGQHGLSNLTHTPGAAFDVRTRDKTQDELDNLVDSALYSRPASIGYNDGTGPFAAHMHVDTNAGYGSGLQSHSSLGGLSDYAKQELSRYDEEMKSGLGYTPPVPESIAPVPEARPTTQDMIARNPFDSVAPQGVQVASSDGMLSGSVRPSTENPNVTPDGVPINRVRSISIKPGQTLPEAQEQQPVEEPPASFLSSFSPISTAHAAVPTVAEANANISLGPNPVSAIGTGAIGFTPPARASASLSVPEPETEVEEITPPQALPDLPARTIRTLPEIAEPRQATQRFKEQEEESSPIAKASEVWSGKAAEGFASDGSKLSRNPDGSISRFSQKSGLTEKVSDGVDGWNGPSVGDTSAKTGGFWGEKLSGALPSGGGYQGGQQIRQGPSLVDRIKDAYRSLSESKEDRNKNSGRSGLSSYGQHAYDTSQQVRDAVDNNSPGLW